MTNIWIYNNYSKKWEQKSFGIYEGNLDKTQRNPDGPGMMTVYIRHLFKGVDDTYTYEGGVERRENV